MTRDERERQAVSCHRDQHYSISGHTVYWTYTIQRGKGRIVIPGEWSG